MAADIVPVRLGLTKGDLYTLWAPSWRDADDEWQALPRQGRGPLRLRIGGRPGGVRQDQHATTTSPTTPRGTALTEASAHRFDPAEDRQHDLIGVPELVAEKPTEESVDDAAPGAGDRAGHRLGVRPARRCRSSSTATRSWARSAAASTRSTAAPAASAGPRSRRSIGRSWDGVVDAIDEIVTIPDVDGRGLGEGRGRTGRAGTRARGGRRGRRRRADDVVIDDEVDTDEESRRARRAGRRTRCSAATRTSGRRSASTRSACMTGGGTFYTLRCYLDDEPIFLGRNGRISVFGSERSLARYLADEHESDLSDLAPTTTSRPRPPTARCRSRSPTTTSTC